MKVILLKDVKNVGKKDDVVEVSDGYANNYLIPRGLAVRNTTGAQGILKQQKSAQKAAKDQEIEDAKQIKAKLEKITLEFKLKVGEGGKPFGSISLKQIESELKNKHQINIDKRKFIDKHAVNALGVTNLRIELAKNVTANIKIHVEEEQ